MLCSKCGKEIEDGAIFCDYCGEFLTSKQSDDEPSANKTVVTVSAEDIVELHQNNDSFESNDIVTISANTNAKKTFNKAQIKVIIAVLCLIIVVAVSIVVIFALGSNKNSNTSSAQNTSSNISGNVVSSDVSSVDTSADTSSVPEKFSKEVLLGDWEFSLKATQVMANNGFVSDADIKLLMRFNLDGTVQLICNKNDYKSANDSMQEDYFAYLRKGGIYEVYSNKGLSKSQVDAMLAEYGMSIDAFVDVLVKDMQKIDPLADKKYTSDGYIILTDDTKPTEYTISGEKILFVPEKDIRRETYFSFQYKNNTITVIEGDYAEGILNGKVLSKK